jgi:K+-sensing histidine kinase KdpD
MKKTTAFPPLDNLEQEREALRLKVFSDVAHDLKTPLSCIIGSLGTLESMSEMLTTEQRETLINIALTEAQRLNDFITEMLEKVKP